MTEICVHSERLVGVMSPCHLYGEQGLQFRDYISLSTGYHIRIEIAEDFRRMCPLSNDTFKMAVKAQNWGFFSEDVRSVLDQLLGYVLMLGWIPLTCCKVSWA